MSVENMLSSAVLGCASPTDPPSLNPRILMVSEECDLRQLNTEVLIDAGYEVDVVEDGASAWRALQFENFDLVFADNGLTSFDGVDLGRKLHSAGITMPVIVAINILPSWESYRYPWFLKATKLFKPYSIAELLRSVDDVLRPAISVRLPTAPLPRWRSQRASFRM